MTKQIGFKKLTPNAKEPTKAHLTDSGFDLYALEYTQLAPNRPTKISTGIALQIPPGIGGFIWDKSSIGSKGIKVLGGVIDQTYTGEIIVCLINLDCSSIDIRTMAPPIQSVLEGQKIAQICFFEMPDIIMYETKELHQTERGDKGFGSTGK